jgi:hypothetical protein
MDAIFHRGNEIQQIWRVLGSIHDPLTLFVVQL